MDNSATPLADYFWIAGVEAISYDDDVPPVSLPVDSTINEDGEPDDSHMHSGQPKANAARHSRQNSANRLSKTSCDGRFSMATFEEREGTTRSNRSSATIKPTKTSDSNGSANGNSNGHANVSAANAGGTAAEAAPLGHFDFDTALVKFAAERETFLQDLSFSAGAKTQSRPPMVKPRAERIRADETPPSGRMSPLKSIKGSIRRKISFRDMNSMRKQPAAARLSVSSRAASIRTAKRLSNYNSVIPPPEPLNMDADMHPLKRRFEPVLLDRYPPKTATDEVGRRGKFPDYVPMFAFPNDIQIVSSDDRPRSTWHGFTMTSEDNSRLYGITIIVWVALTADVADEVETKCEEWRQNHMSNEERELAASLGERLAGERIHLSQLLSRLPAMASGSRAREELEEEIGLVEEKITLMTDMLRPLRHGAASKIEGLTAGESGLWIPRAYGILGREPANMAFWKEWLKAIVVPMTDGSVLRVPPSSPVKGLWQPLERYVVNLCSEAVSPLGSKTQVELVVRELRLYARKEGPNELPGWRTVDLYALFRSLSLENVVAVFEYGMSESRIIFLSSHTSMLHLACHGLASLLYPLKWASIFIPVLPARLISALEAPCPYIIGVERRYERIELPEDDYVLVDLDKNTLAAPHAQRLGVAVGPPPYAIESFPYDSFSSENGSIFMASPRAGTLAKWVSQNSASFGEATDEAAAPVFNAFSVSATEGGRSERPGTSKSSGTSPQSDSGFALTATLREKRSGHFGEDKGRRSSSFGLRPGGALLNGHQANASISGLSSTLAASTIMPSMPMQPPPDSPAACSICDDRPDGDAMYQCAACATAFDADRVRAAFARCMASLLYTYRKHLARPSKQQRSNGQLYAFDMDAFIKGLPHEQQDYARMLRDTQAFNEFIHQRETTPPTHPSVRLFDEVIAAKRARRRPGLSSGLSRLSTIRASHGASTNASCMPPPARPLSTKATPFLADTSEHIWRTASVPPAKAHFPGEYRSVVTRIPSRLDRTLMREPRSIHAVLRPEQRGPRLVARKQVPSMLGSTPPP
ncbi:hypothetical protein CDD81_3252 [Ophiocordyceps australis]|uniref:UDENN domain-containing protein n=1 Tax=Ophiocordyceps australis TaxID=1399860 RepID=A0A2C5YE19_9HYPO|nr:hypothetical protein CDD81_3252 [Ophiocordyceps australis]